MIFEVCFEKTGGVLHYNLYTYFAEDLLIHADKIIN